MCNQEPSSGTETASAGSTQNHRKGKWGIFSEIAPPLHVIDSRGYTQICYAQGSTRAIDKSFNP